MEVTGPSLEQKVEALELANLNLRYQLLEAQIAFLEQSLSFGRQKLPQLVKEMQEVGQELSKRQKDNA